MKKIFLITAFNFILLTINGYALIRNLQSETGNTKVDSLLTLLKKDKEDTNKVKHLNELGWILKSQNPDTAIVLGNQALNIIAPIQSTEFISVKEGIEENRILFLRASTLINLGVYYYHKADYFRALEYYLKALKIDEELNNRKGIASCFSNIAIVYSIQGDYLNALDYYLKALKIDEELNNKNGILSRLGNIGIIYFDIADYPKSLDYYLKALKIAEEVGYKEGIAVNLTNIGAVYSEQGHYDKAVDYYFKALKIAEEQGYKDGIAINLVNIGIVYTKQGDYPNALDNSIKALKIAEESGDKNRIAATLRNIGLIYTKTGKFKEAEQYLKKSTALDESIGALDRLRENEETLSGLYDTLGRYKEAFTHYKKAVALKDTLYGQERKKQLIRKEMNYEFEKKEAATKAEHDKEMAVAEAEKKKQQFVLILVSGVLVLIFLFAGFIFRSLRITRKQNNIIELQKFEVSRQKEIVEKQKEKIVDSITYAQRIQQSILMEESEIQKYLPSSFIYYQPKDIVSGDFYWFTKIEDKIIIAAVDCTGHGVPGAFMSMIGNTLLNQIVNEKRITKPSEILRLLNLGVYEALHQGTIGSISDDGMDIALCTIDYQKNEIQYAGAQNPLYVVFTEQIEVVKADTHGIGGGGKIVKIRDPVKREYTNHVIPIKDNMSIYLSSDGFIDQFGGSNRKKFGTQKFKELLLSIQHLSMQKQKELVLLAHTEWKENTAQIDDILVIGVKFH